MHNQTACQDDSEARPRSTAGRAVLIGIAAMLLATTCFAQKESLLIGPGDQLHIQVFDTPEMEQHARVTDAGTVPLLFIGDVKLAGLTPGDAAHEVELALISKHLMLKPQVAITVEQYATQNVSVMGQVRNPGTYPISTASSVVTVLAMAGGLADLADRHITIERRANSADTITYFLSNESNQALNSEVQVYPGDTVIVPKAGVIYVLGDVGRPGGYPITTNDSRMSALQALAMAGAANKTSVLSRAKLIRRTPTGVAEVQLLLADIEKGKRPDVELRPDDVLFIPSSWMKNLSMNASSIAASATSAMIYSHP